MAKGGYPLAYLIQAFCSAILFLLAFAWMIPAANAADITWSGLYRMEAVDIQNPDLSNNSMTAYGLAHLILTPKIIAADSITINSRLDILNNPNFGIDNSGVVYSTAGDVLGNGPGYNSNVTGPANTSGTASTSNTYTQSERAGNIWVTELYLTWTHEFGQLIVGRAPMQFGLGTMFNAGNGIFDHFIDTKDIVAYRLLVLPNFFVMPMIGKTSLGPLGGESSVTDYMIHAEYDNPETDLKIGAIYDMRISTYGAGGNDAPVAQYTGNPNSLESIGGPCIAGSCPTIGTSKITQIGVFARQKIGAFSMGIETDLASGDTGVLDAVGNPVGLNAYGIAAEFSYKPDSSKGSEMFKVGIASGDDPGTFDTYEGFAFNRNYKVGLLLFNHPLGQADFLRTGLIRDTTQPVNNQIDSEAISNAIYFAPSYRYQYSPSLWYEGTFIYAILNKDPIGQFDPGQGTYTSSGTDHNLGYEFDFSVTYKPMERLTWESTAGFLIPGAAWDGGALGSSLGIGSPHFAYGIQTRAAISF